MIDKEKEKTRNLRKYKKKREVNRANGGKVGIGTLKSRELFKKGKKFCPMCKKTKGLRCFYKSTSKFGVSSYCSLCMRKQNKKYYSKENKQNEYKNDKNKVRNNRLKTKFGITLKEYNKKLGMQCNKCIICGKTSEENKKALAVDHNHDTGEIRDLLCANCNAAVGFVQENINVAREIVKYIERWEESVISR